MKFCPHFQNLKQEQTNLLFAIFPSSSFSVITSKSQMANSPLKTHLFTTKNWATFDAKVAQLRLKNNRLTV